RLLVAETQVERLSRIIEQRNESVVSRYLPDGPQRNQGSPAQAAAPAQPAKASLPFPNLPPPPANQPNQAPAPRIPPSVQGEADMPIAPVVLDKASLRTGPGKDNSPLMAVAKNTRLAVETRQGAWYRVIAPTGARAWVAADAIGFGPRASIAAIRSDTPAENS